MNRSHRWAAHAVGEATSPAGSLMPPRTLRGLTSGGLDGMSRLRGVAPASAGEADDPAGNAAGGVAGGSGSSGGCGMGSAIRGLASLREMPPNAKGEAFGRRGEMSSGGGRNPGHPAAGRERPSGGHAPAPDLSGLCPLLALSVRRHADADNIRTFGRDRGGRAAGPRWRMHAAGPGAAASAHSFLARVKVSPSRFWSVTVALRKSMLASSRPGRTSSPTR